VPVLLDPYGGPHGQRVRNQWSEANLFNMLLAKRGMAVLIVDNRGSGNRGKKFSEVVWKDLGRTELKDQLASLDQALAAFPQLDGKRLGIWGWSYGGYMTSYSMTHSDRFSCGMAGAPVTDWHNYDSIYTERYMGLPTENDKGYKESSAVLAAKDLHGKLLIAHGTSDDNVHTQNDIQFIEELIQAGKQYDYIVYPRKTHGVTGTADRMHLWDRVEAHFEGCLLGK
jgi:dipeptidyl-peptidase-4